MRCNKIIELFPPVVVTYCDAEQGHEGRCRPNFWVAKMYGVDVQSKVEASPNSLGVKCHS